MEKVYENNNILFKILPCILIAMYAVMCLYGAKVYAEDTTETTNKTFTNSDGVKYILPEAFSEYKYFYFIRNNSLNETYAFASNFLLTFYQVSSSDKYLRLSATDIDSSTWTGPRFVYCTIKNRYLKEYDFSSCSVDPLDWYGFSAGFTLLDCNANLLTGLDARNDVTVFKEATLSERGAGGSDNTSNSVSGGNTTGDSKDNENSDTSWLGSIGNWFNNLFDKIGNIANAIGEIISSIFAPLFDFIINLLDWLNPFSENFILLKLWNFLTDIVSFINPFSDNFLGKKIVSLIGDLLKSLFVPEDDYFTNKIDNLKSSLNEKIPYQQYLDDMESLKNANDVKDSNEINTFVSLNNYTISDKLVINMNKFIDFSIFSKYRSTWFVWVRVVIYVLLLLYNINEFTKTLRGVGVINSAGKVYEEGKHADVGKHSA